MFCNKNIVAKVDEPHTISKESEAYKLL